MPQSSPPPRLVCFLLGLISLLGMLPAPGAWAQGAGQRPNVLFILCDDLRPDALGCYGSKYVKTPHIDALAADGVRFANTFCTTSLCSPSRASILTGLYAHRHTVRDNFTELPTQLPHWPGVCRKAVTRLPISASGIWGKTMMPRVPALIGSRHIRDKASIMTRSGI